MMKVISYSFEIYDEVFEFLLKYEKYSVRLVEEFVQKKPSFFILMKDNVVCGVFSINDSLQLKHCLPLKDKDSIVQAGISIIDFFNDNRNFKIFSIIGEKTGTEILSRAFNVSYKKNQTSSQDYLLMESTGINFTQKNILRDGCTIKKCSEDDVKEIFPLQKSYELEEVYIDHKKFKSAVCLFSLEKKLKNSCMVALYFDGRAVSKGEINSYGIKYAQLGGIFTGKEFRKNGFAKAIVEHLVNEMDKKNKKCVLFVKIINENAINLYEKCGFKEISKYKIVYY